MYAQTGNCPHCGAPIYCRSPWWSVLPPPPIYSCNCRGHVAGVSALDIATVRRYEQLAGRIPPDTQDTAETPSRPWSKGKRIDHRVHAFTYC